MRDHSISQVPARTTIDPARPFRDLRLHNERHWSRARLLEAQRRQRIERMMRVARERLVRFSS